MDELDPNARDLLRHYRDEVRLAAPARERIGERIAVSLDAEPTTVAPARPRHAALAAVLLTSLAAAAAVLLFCDVRGRLGATGSDGEAAPYIEQAPATRSLVPVSDEAPAASTASTAPTTADTPGPAPAEPPRRAGKTGPSALAAELDLLRRARAAIDAGDVADAQALLDEHARTFASGQMQQDRDILRIEARCAAGDAALARAGAAEFLHDHPGSPHAARVRTICADRPAGDATPD